MPDRFSPIPTRCFLWIGCWLGGCAQVGITEEPTESAPTANQIRIEKDLNYCSRTDRSGRCDVYLPSHSAPANGYPVVVVVHGGGWISGDKWTVEGYSRALARSGIAAVTSNYRLAPEHKFPAQVDDVRQVLIWVKQNAERYSWNPQRVGMFGYSAGGHLTSLVSALADEPLPVRATASAWPVEDQRWQQLPKVQAICVGGPPCDFRSLPMDNTTLGYFLGGSRREKPDAYIAASPSAHVSSSDPPTQIIQGEDDLLVPLSGSRQFHQTQIAAGIDSRLEIMPGQGHMLTFLNPKTRAKMVAFFQEHLQTAD